MVNLIVFRATALASFLLTGFLGAGNVRSGRFDHVHYRSRSDIQRKSVRL